LKQFKLRFGLVDTGSTLQWVDAALRAVACFVKILARQVNVFFDNLVKILARVASEIRSGAFCERDEVRLG